MGLFWRFLPDVCQLRSHHIGKYVRATEHEIIFWPNYSKFAVEFAWNSKIPQNVRKTIQKVFSKKSESFERGKE